MMDETSETKRDRVRRLLINQLIADGFRMPHRTPDEDERKYLDRVADELAYMSDEGLRALRETLRTKGEGSARCFWPKVATVIGFAEAFEPRRLEEVPALARWFGSRAGLDAAAAGRLVAEFVFFEKYKRPPVTPVDRDRVTARAQDWASKVERIRDRQARGVPPFPGDSEFLAWYDETEARARALVRSSEERAA